MKDPLDLDRRTGLPDALRILAEKYPREIWETHPEFNALTRFWLDRHLMFRRLQGMLIAETETYLDRTADPARYAANLSGLAGTFLNELHGHHGIEDAHYFPLLASRDARLTSGFELLDSDHHALDAGLHGLADRTNAVLRSPAAVPAEALRVDLVRFEALLDRHLIDEEELVVPMILEYAGAGLS
jgi:iron-sulfur cluster repair protein YtfE (RIC family)